MKYVAEAGLFFHHGKAMHDDVKSNPKTYDDILMKNLSAQTATGHKGAVSKLRQSI